MHIAVVGLSYLTAPMEVREELAHVAEPLKESLASRLARSTIPLKEVVVLSTCNRVELYMALPDPALRNGVFQHLLNLKPDDWFRLAPHVYSYYDQEAARHLIRVACGLNSMLLGETQILGQVADAYRTGEEAVTTGPLLSRLFQGAAAAGKRARTETTIAAQPLSLSFAAVDALKALYPDLGQKRVVVVGAGTMGRLAAQQLRDLGVSQLAVVNRSPERTQSLARQVQGEAWPWEALVQTLASADVAVVATSASSYVVGLEEIGQAMSQRPDRPLTLVDIGMPRNVNPAVGHFRSVKLLDIDALGSGGKAAQAATQEAVAQVEALVEEGVVCFEEWRRARSVAPVIGDLYASAESLRQREVARSFRRLAHLSEADREAVEVLTRSIVDKFLQAPAQKLQALAIQSDPTDYQEAIRDLFELGNGEAAGPGHHRELGLMGRGRKRAPREAQCST
ncbi:MAG: glutamyl-tRNA reductase [Chloroflexi bacterium]|nr:glutamyl-tRNA reductase [Chloroflexota bacterium]